MEATAEKSDLSNGSQSYFFNLTASARHHAARYLRERGNGNQLLNDAASLYHKIGHLLTEPIEPLSSNIPVNKEGHMRFAQLIREACKLEEEAVGYLEQWLMTN